MHPFELLHQTRRNVLAVIEGLTITELNTIPTGFNNSMLWNIGHMLVTQQVLHYRLSNLPMRLDKDFVDRFKKGSSAVYYDESVWETIKSNFLKTVDQLEEDVDNGLFQEFTMYTTSYGTTLTDIKSAIEFDLAHEALHFGYIMAQKRAVLA